MAKRWNLRAGHVVRSKTIDTFIEDLIVVYKKHNLVLGHEDHHGAFIVEGYDESNVDWLKAAHDGRAKFQEPGVQIRGRNA